MTKRSKILDKFLLNPSSVKCQSIENILFDLGFTKKESRWWSHQRYKHEKLENMLVIPVHWNDCKEVYKQITAKIIKQNKLHL